MRRIFAEHLDPGTLAEPATIGLVDRFGLQTLVAVTPAQQTAALGAALAKLSATRGGVGVWPLLEDDAGYWPSDHNAAAFSARVQDVLRFAEDHGARPRTVVVDLEPPLAVTSALFGPPAQAARAGLGRLAASRRGPERRRRRDAHRTFAALARDIHARGIETLATVVPLVLLDPLVGSGPWQALLQTPCFGPGWSRLCPMLYTSIIAQALPSGRLARARALAVALVRGAARPPAAAALGLVGTGKLREEAILPDAEALAADVGALRAAGVDDLSLFALEGVLDRPDPEAWCSAFTLSPPAPIRGAAARGFGWGVRGARTLARILTGPPIDPAPRV